MGAKVEEERPSDERIIKACQEGNVTFLRRLVRLGLTVSNPEMMIDAAYCGHISVVRCLGKELGADVNKANDGGATPLFIAAQEGHLDVVRCLGKELGADVDKAANDGVTPLSIAAQNGHLGVVRCLGKELGADVNKANDGGATPLSIAAHEGHLGVVRCLGKELGADVDKAMNDGTTPLGMASLKGHLDVVQYLGKELGADVNKANDGGATPLYVAAQKGHLDVVRCLGKELGADVNKADIDGTTPLMVAAYNRHLDVVRCLVKGLGADVNKADIDGATPLMAAASELDYNVEVVKSLLKMKADPQLRSVAVPGVCTPRTALEWARAAGASPAQTEYLELRTHCGNPACAGRGFKGCARCKRVRYCSVDCQSAHWPTHKLECKAAAPEAADSKRPAEEDSEEEKALGEKGRHTRAVIN